MGTLPDRVLYLESVLQQMSSIDPEELDVRFEPAELEAVLRQRVSGKTIPDAKQLLVEDRSALESWLRDSGDEGHAIGWIIGFLGRPGPLARHLLAPPEAESPTPIISFEPPQGWSAESRPLTLELRKGRKSMGAIFTIEPFTLSTLLVQHQATEEMQESFCRATGVVASWTHASVEYGRVHGQKYLMLQTAPAPWKRVEYLLEVPGGAVHIILDANGKDFDETVLEDKLPTLELKHPLEPK